MSTAGREDGVGAGEASAAAAGAELVRWPAEAGRREQLAARGIPRLLLVEPGERPPPLDRDEDWVRLPADERDVWARLHNLALRRAHGAQRPRVRDIAGGVRVDFGGRTVVLGQDEGVLLRALVDRLGHVVPWAVLVELLWPDGDGDADLAIERLRALGVEIAPTGLAIHNVGASGVVLDRPVPSGRGSA